MNHKKDVRDVFLGKELVSLCGSSIHEDLLKSRLSYIQSKTGLLKNCSVSDFADLCDLSKHPKCVKEEEINANDLDSSLNECDICLDIDLNGRGTEPLKCGHYFHKECLIGVQNCPICRSPTEFLSKEEILTYELRTVLLGTEIMKECGSGRLPKEQLTYRLKYLQRHHDAFKSCSEDDFAKMCDLKKEPSSQCKSSILAYAKGRDMDMENEQLNTCSICMVEIDDTGKGTVSTTCGHYFHEGCIKTWFRQSKDKCPICKKETGIVGQQQPVKLSYTLQAALADILPETIILLRTEAREKNAKGLEIFYVLNFNRIKRQFPRLSDSDIKRKALDIWLTLNPIIWSDYNNFPFQDIQQHI
jgi:Ring finger domain